MLSFPAPPANPHQSRHSRRILRVRGHTAQPLRTPPPDPRFPSQQSPRPIWQRSPALPDCTSPAEKSAPSRPAVSPRRPLPHRDCRCSTPPLPALLLAAVARSAHTELHALLTSQSAARSPVSEIFFVRDLF